MPLISVLLTYGDTKLFVYLRSIWG